MVVAVAAVATSIRTSPLAVVAAATSVSTRTVAVGAVARATTRTASATAENKIAIARAACSKQSPSTKQNPSTLVAAAVTEPIKSKDGDANGEGRHRLTFDFVSVVHFLADRIQPLREQIF